MTCFFIVSCARSGSTSLATILNEAEGVTCLVEPEPTLNHETREMMEGRIKNPFAVINNSVVKRVYENFQPSQIYGEKTINFAPFIPQLYLLLHPKFIFIKRDGRDVVRSLVDWHDNAFGNIYRECRDPGTLSPRAFDVVSNLPIHKDTSDYSRPRPLPGDPLYDEWETLSRFEMCAFYWTRINEIYLDALDIIPRTNWMEIDYTDPSPDDILSVLSFIGAEDGLTSLEIETLLNRKVNSLQDRFNEPNTSPNWKNWDGQRRRHFKRTAQTMMEKLGHSSSPEAFWKPDSYGLIWLNHPDIEKWFNWMWASRRYIHDQFITWTEDHRFQSVADYGCGIGVGYNDVFKDTIYIGVDLSPQNITWCLTHRKNPKHVYYNHDCITTPLLMKPDLIFSSGTIDNAYDIDQFLKAMIRDSSGWIYATAYRGWFPDLEEHVYHWNPEHGCFYNNLSPRQVKDTLTDNGCTDITVAPLPKYDGGSDWETLIIAKTPEEGAYGGEAQT